MAYIKSKASLGKRQNGLQKRMKSSRKISIITPSYNQGNFIEDATVSYETRLLNYEHIIAMVVQLMKHFQYLENIHI